MTCPLASLLDISYTPGSLCLYTYIIPTCKYVRVEANAHACAQKARCEVNAPRDISNRRASVSPSFPLTTILTAIYTRLKDACACAGPNESGDILVGPGRANVCDYVTRALFSFSCLNNTLQDIITISQRGRFKRLHLFISWQLSLFFIL